MLMAEMVVVYLTRKRSIWPIFYCFTTRTHSKQIYHLQYMAYSVENENNLSAARQTPATIVPRPGFEPPIRSRSHALARDWQKGGLQHTGVQYIILVITYKDLLSLKNYSYKRLQ